MFSRWYSVAVGVFWFSAMGWLFQQKLLPPLLVGEPPNYRTILNAENANNRPVSWDVYLNDNHLGKATTRTERQTENVSEIHSLVELDGLPLRDIAPAVFTLFSRLLGGDRDSNDAKIAIHAESTLQVDPLGHPSSFRSMIKLRPPSGKDAHLSPLAGMNLTLSMRGQVVADQMEVKVKFGDFERQTEIYLPPDSLIGDVLSPPNYLPELRVGQTWTVPIYSPFRDPREPMEILHAAVERKEPILWDQKLVHTLVVAYRGDPGRGMSSNQTVRVQAWVDLNGQVIKQELMLPQARLVFVRSATPAVLDPVTRDPVSPVQAASSTPPQNLDADRSAAPSLTGDAPQKQVISTTP